MGCLSDHVDLIVSNRLRLRITGKYAYAEVDKPDGTLVLVCSTYEWAVIRHLYG